MCSRGPFKSFPSLFRSHTCGRCTRRDAGTSSPLETASVSNMRTSWVRAGRLVCCSEPQSPLCFYLEKRHWTWLHPVTRTHTVIVSKNVKRKKKIWILTQTQNITTLKFTTDDWTFRVCVFFVVTEIVSCHYASFMQIILLILIHIAFFHLLNPNLLHNLLFVDIW